MEGQLQIVSRYECTEYSYTNILIVQGPTVFTYVLLYHVAHLNLHTQKHAFYIYIYVFIYVYVFILFMSLYIIYT